MAEDEVKTEEKPEKKLYKGEVKTVKELAKGLGEPTPIQAVKQSYQNSGFTQKVPPTFIITRFSPGYAANRRLMHYYNPVTKIATQQEVPEDFELNVLSGRRAQELNQDWNTTVRSELSRLSRRISCTIGTDPEIFVVDDKGVVPAWKFLGSKEKPTKWTYGSYEGELYWDGFQAEFTTPGHLSCLIEMSNAIHGALTMLEAKKPKGSKLTLQTVLPVDPEELAQADEKHVAFGCAPSKNVYGLRGNSQEGRNVPYRFTGGHIHMGLNDPDKAKIPEIVRALDTVLGVACVSLFADYDSPVRRQFYGQAGEYRTPPHGLEYRVLSNAWISHPAVMHLVFDLARAVAGVVASGLHIKSLWSTSEDETLKCIMNSDVDLARSILERERPAFTQIMYTGGSVYGSTDGQAKAWNAWTKGLKEVIAEPENIAKNWHLNMGNWTNSIRTFHGAVASKKKV